MGRKEHAGVVHEHIDAGVGRSDASDERIDRRETCEVNDLASGVRTERPDSIGDLLLVTGSDDYRGPSLGKHLCDGVPDPDVRACWGSAGM